ncbi:hypothetical protein LEP3755_25720 [Leptolyngbya sp. NIES-3755]|nr:hypothetical protein LEP3755_25720 [Leptolyngbya sp. NIES-3755]
METSLLCVPRLDDAEKEQVRKIISALSEGKVSIEGTAIMPAQTQLLIGILECTLKAKLKIVSEGKARELAGSRQKTERPGEVAAIRFNGHLRFVSNRTDVAIQVAEDLEDRVAFDNDNRVSWSWGKAIQVLEEMKKLHRDAWFDRDEGGGIYLKEARDWKAAIERVEEWLED